MTKILIVEDQPAIANALRMLFDLNDVESMVASDPDEAVRLVEKGEVGTAAAGHELHARRDERR
jgi:DNA-binding response OmpR family regulator